MAIRQIISLLLATFIAVPTNANAWFFFFIPGSVTRAIGDALTGAEGQNCVGESAKVGDVIRSPSGNTATIKSLSGTSSGCIDSARPIRALIVFTYSFTSKAGIDVPDGYEPKTLTETQRFNGGLLMATYPAKKLGLFVSSRKREGSSDPLAIARVFGTGVANALEDAKQYNDEHIVVNDMRAWRFEVTGKEKGIFGQRYTYLVTVLEGEQEFVIVNAWASSDNYANEKESLKQFAAKVVGIKSTSAPVAVSEPPTYVAAVADGNAQAATSQPIAAKAVIVITSEPLRGNMAEVEINGKRVASVGPDQPYKGLIEPGKVVITTKGGRAEIMAESDKEYLFEIVLKPSTAGGIMFGLAGSSSMGDYPITLKSTSNLKPVVVEQNSASPAKSVTSNVTDSASREEKLRELKKLNDAGLISQEIYLERQRKILE